jgi:hypothetical protein
MAAPINVSDNSVKAWDQKAANSFGGGTIKGDASGGVNYTFGSGSSGGFGGGVPKWVWIAAAVLVVGLGWLWFKHKRG